MLDANKRTSRKFQFARLTVASKLIQVPLNG